MEDIFIYNTEVGSIHEERVQEVFLPKGSDDFGKKVLLCAAHSTLVRLPVEQGRVHSEPRAGGGTYDIPHSKEPCGHLFLQ